MVNEAYLRLMEMKSISWQDRTHFFAVAAQVMRHILVDAARARISAKRGGQKRQVNTSGFLNLGTRRDPELVALDDALNALEEIDSRKARVIELRFFVGLSVEEAAEVLKISAQSVMRDWKLAKAWLEREVIRKAR